MLWRRWRFVTWLSVNGNSSFWGVSAQLYLCCREDAVNEVRVLASISHSKVIRYYEAFVDNDRLYIVSVLLFLPLPQHFIASGHWVWKARRPSRKDQTAGHQGETFRRGHNMGHLYSSCSGTASGACKGHYSSGLNASEFSCVWPSPPQDIKSPNIFMYSSTEFKLGDLGVAKVMKAGMAQTQIGTVSWIFQFSSRCLIQLNSLTTWALKYGEERHITRKAIFGLLVWLWLSVLCSLNLWTQAAYCMSSQPCSVHSKPGMSALLHKKFSAGYTRL